MSTRRNTRLVTTAVVWVTTVTFAAAQETIKIGNTNPYSGPASAYGQIGQTIGACIEMINEQGGINGQQIEWISYDDAYSPPKAVEQIRKLVESDQVDILFQTLGTPSNTAIHKYVNQKKIPHLFVATGATKWGDPENFPWTIGWQPNYQTEAKIYARYIIDNMPDSKIAVLFQNDDFGKDYLTGLKEGLGDKADEMIIAELPFEVADPTVDSQVISAKASGADIFFNIGTPKFAAQAIKKVHEIGWQPVHFLTNVSTSVGAVMEPAGVEASQGIISAGYLMDPTDPKWAEDPEFKEWSAFMDKYYPDGDKKSSFTTYGYSACKTLEHVLQQAGDDLSRENIMKQAASIEQYDAPMLLPGITISTSESDFYPIEAMQLQRFEGDSWQLFGDVISAESGGS